VAAFDDAKRSALLSLRQTEILMKLQSVTLDPGLEKLKPKGWCVPAPNLQCTHKGGQLNDPDLSPGVRTIHARIHSRRPILRNTKGSSFSRMRHAISTADHSITPPPSRAASHTHRLAQTRSHRLGVHGSRDEA